MAGLVVEVGHRANRTRHGFRTGDHLQPARLPVLPRRRAGDRGPLRKEGPIAGPPPERLRGAEERIPYRHRDSRIRTSVLATWAWCSTASGWRRRRLDAAAAWKRPACAR